MNQQFPQQAQFAVSAGVNPITQGAVAPEQAAPAVQQVALPPGFNIMQAAVHKAPAAKTSSRTPYWECSIEELRTRISFRDVQAVAHKNKEEYHCRIFLSPKPVDLAMVLGADEHGNPRNTIIVPAHHKDAIEEQLREYAKQGSFDAALLACAEESRIAKEKAKMTPKRAAVDTGAADAALAELESTAGLGVALAGGIPAQAQPLAQVQPVAQQAAPLQQVAQMPTQMQAANPVQQAPGMVLPTFPA